MANIIQDLINKGKNLLRSGTLTKLLGAGQYDSYYSTDGYNSNEAEPVIKRHVVGRCRGQ